MIASSSHVFVETLSNLNENTGSINSSDWYGLSYKNDFSTKYIRTYVEGELKYTRYYNDYIFSLPEFYVSHDTKNTCWSFGKKIIKWHPDESYWLLSDLNPLQGMGLLNDKQEGISGLFTDVKFGKYKLSLFASYLYIPTTNPSYNFGDGAISSYHDWVSLPPTRTVVLEQTLPIDYTVKTPEMMDVFFQTSFGLRIQRKFYNGTISAFTIYKPENQFRQHGEAKLAKEYDRVPVTISPAINHHVVYGIDANQKLSRFLKVNAGVKVIDPNGDFKTNLGGIIKDPITFAQENHDVFDSEYYKIEPSYAKQSYFHAKTSYIRQKYSLALHYIQLLSGGDSGESFYGDEIKWRQAVGFFGQYKLSDKFSILVNLKYDLKMKDNIIKNELSYKVLNHIKFSLGLEMLKADNNSSYWSSYRSNDLFYSSLGITF